MNDAADQEYEYPDYCCGSCASFSAPYCRFMPPTVIQRWPETFQFGQVVKVHTVTVYPTVNPMTDGCRQWSPAKTEQDKVIDQVVTQWGRGTPREDQVQPSLDPSSYEDD